MQTTWRIQQRVGKTEAPCRQEVEERKTMESQRHPRPGSNVQLLGRSALSQRSTEDLKLDLFGEFSAEPG
jgi:hypothetical protein